MSLNSYSTRTFTKQVSESRILTVRKVEIAATKAGRVSVGRGRSVMCVVRVDGCSSVYTLL